MVNPEPMMNETHCPDAASLERFVLGKSSGEEAIALEQHLQGCERCLAVLHTLPMNDSMVDALQSGSGKAEAAEAEGVELLIAWLKKLGAHIDPRAAKSLDPGPTPGNDTTEDYGKAGYLDDTPDFEFLDPGQHPDELGRLGPYQIRKVLGTGGMGIVFEAFDPGLDRRVALKTMLPALAAQPSAKQRFLREAKAAARIRHDHIVTIYQVGEDRGVCYLAMEYLQGESLERRLARESIPSLADTLRILRECAEALAAAHAQGLIHRDIKPANIWLESAVRGPWSVAKNPTDPEASDYGLRATDCRVKILDFGLALISADNAHLTQSGAVVGTPAYMAPEQLRGQPIDARADLFSLGCVLYRMATGQAPFKGTHAVSTLIAVATTNPIPPRQLNPSLPTALCDLIMQLLCKAPEGRPTSASAVLKAIRAIEQAEGGSPSPLAPGASPRGTGENDPEAPTISDLAVTPAHPRPAAARQFGRPKLLGVAAALLASLLAVSAYSVWMNAGKPGDAGDPGAPTPTSSQVQAIAEDPANTVRGEGRSRKQVYADATRSLENVLDWHDIVGASAADLAAWQDQLEPGFRVAHATARRGTGPTLFNAVAVREKNERLGRFVACLPSHEAVDADWARNNDKDLFRILDHCTFPQQDDAAKWAQCRLWVKDEIQIDARWTYLADDMKAKISAERKDGRRPRVLEWLTVANAYPYQAVFAEADPVPEWELNYALSADQLVRAVQHYRERGWRPDLLSPYLQNGELRFVLLALDNHDGADWVFRCDMSAKAYRAQSEQLGKDGMFPLILASYGDDDKVRYVAMWVRGRAPGSAPPPSLLNDATRADRAVKAITSTGTMRGAIYKDEARAIADVLDFQELTGATAEELKKWRTQLDPAFRIASLSDRKGTGITLFNAIAIRESKTKASDLIFEGRESVDKEWKRLEEQERMRPIALFTTLSADQPPVELHNSVWVKDSQGPHTWGTYSWQSLIVELVRGAQRAQSRPIYLAATALPDGHSLDSILGNDAGRSWDAFFTATQEELFSTIEFYQRKGWRPDVIAPYWNKGELFFMIVVVDNSDQVDWRFRTHMGLKEYQAESAAQKARGLFPLSVSSHGNGPDVWYSAIFVRYRTPRS